MTEETKNAMTLFGGTTKVSLGKAAKSMATQLRQSASEGSTTQLPDGGVYINFSGKMGKYSIGQDKEDADPDALWLLNTFGFEKGWVCWKGGSPAAKRMGSVYKEPIPVPDFDEHGPFNEARGEGWFAAKALMLRCIEDGRQGYFMTNTKSAVNEFSKMEAEVARRLEEGEPAWPIIMLRMEQFTAAGNTNYKPVLEVYGWLGDHQVNQMAEMSSFAEIAEAVDGLIDEAEEMALQGTEEESLEDIAAEEPEEEEAEEEVAEEEVAEEEPKPKRTSRLNQAKQNRAARKSGRPARKRAAV